jgi:hypothetical protein
MIREVTAGIGILIALGVVGHFDQQDQQLVDQKYCEMVSIQKRWMQDHPGAIGREAALARPGWPEHRYDIDCTQHGFFFDQQFSIR